MSDPAVPPNDTPPAEVPSGMTSDTPQDPSVPPEHEMPQAPDTEAPASGAAPAPTTEAGANVEPEQVPTPTAPGMSPAACGAKLTELFPALFVRDGPPRPIKLRIHVDLQARAPGVFSRRVLGPFFARYTTTNAYLKVLSTATERFDLDGQPAGEVTEEHRSAALAELARRREIAIARRASERGSPRPPAPGPRADGAAGDGAERARPARGSRRDGPRAAAHVEGPDGARRPPRGDRPPRPPRAGRPERADAPGARGAASRPPRPERRPERRQDDRPAPRPGHAAEAPEPQDPAQRERALLLRQFESSPLTKSNFCVLKRIAEAELDSQLALARQERDARRRG